MRPRRVAWLILLAPGACAVGIFPLTFRKTATQTVSDIVRKQYPRDNATSGSFCLSAFMDSADACNATIGEVFALVSTASAQQQAQAQAAAAPSACNSTSSHATSTTANATSKAQMMYRLRRIDADALGGLLARAAEEVACPISSGYQ